jgi:hypothetical protein
MIIHVVLLMPPVPDNGAGEEVMDRFRDLLGKVPGLRDVSVGAEFSGRAAPYSLMAVLHLDSRDALQGYLDHPVHKQLVARLEELHCGRIVADIEVAEDSRL